MTRRLVTPARGGAGAASHQCGDCPSSAPDEVPCSPPLGPTSDEAELSAPSFAVWVRPVTYSHSDRTWESVELPDVDCVE